MCGSAWHLGGTAVAADPAPAAASVPAAAAPAGDGAAAAGGTAAAADGAPPGVGRGKVLARVSMPTRQAFTVAEVVLELSNKSIRQV